MPTTNASQPRRPFGSPGTSTRGSEVSGYTAGRYNTVLKTSDGRTILDARCSIAKEYWSDENGTTYALVFALPRGRFIVGYALGMREMLFRGELRDDCADESDARQAARDVSERLIQRDAEDSAAFDARESDDPEEICDECGQSMYRDCNGDARCEECDPPCPCCDDGGGPGADDDESDDDESESDDDGPSDPKAVPQIANLDPFTRAYLELALALDLLQEDCDHESDELYTLDDIADESLAEHAEACRQFQESNQADLEGRNPVRAGQDFWLTRNRHGAGYWDGDYPDGAGRRLTDAAHAWGSSYATVGDGGWVYLS